MKEDTQNKIASLGTTSESTFIHGVSSKVISDAVNTIRFGEI